MVLLFTPHRLGRSSSAPYKNDVKCENAAFKAHFVQEPVNVLLRKVVWQRYFSINNMYKKR